MKIPETSIRELAAFRDTHDVTKSSDELVEVAEPVFARRPTRGVTVPLVSRTFSTNRILASFP
jgi:hypothetical protein